MQFVQLLLPPLQMRPAQVVCLMAVSPGSRAGQRVVSVPLPPQPESLHR